MSGSHRRTRSTSPSYDLAEEVHHLAEITSKRNSLLYRFGIGIAVGCGTALGASVVGAILVLILRTFFVDYFGVELGM